MSDVLSIRKLNEKGIEAMVEYLASMNSDSPPDDSARTKILLGKATTELLPEQIEVDASERFPRRYDLAEYLHARVPRLGIEDPTRDQGLWAWMALLWFDQLAPEVKGKRKVGESARWIPAIGTGWRYYRHFVLGPYMIYDAHREHADRSAVLLADPLNVATSEIYRGFVESPFAACKAAVLVAEGLYYDRAKQRLKRGSGVKGAGGSRRLLGVMMQLDRTYDLHSLNEQDLSELLPAEFDVFR